MPLDLSSRRILTQFERQFYRESVEELRGRWWNKSYGRAARKDLWLWQDGSTWTVGARHGESDREVWRRPFRREDEARALIDSMMKRNGGRAVWLDMTSLVQDSPRRRG